MGYRENEQQNMKQRIEAVLKQDALYIDALKSKPMEELLQEVSIYHQELEYQNLELRRVQEELEKSRSHYVSLFDEAPVAYLVLDHNHRIVAANHSLCLMMKTRSEDLLESPFEKWVSKESQDDVYFHLKNLKTGESQKALQVRLWTNEGAAMTVKLQSVLMEEEGKQEIRMSLMDITKEKELEKALFEKGRVLEEAKQAAECANKTKDQFLANVSHELRTPMNVIYGFLQLAMGTEPSPEQKEYLEHSMSASRRMLRLINHLLDYAFLVSGEITLDMQDMAFSEFLDAFFYRWREESREKPLELVLKRADNLPAIVQADNVKLRQILDHLMENALKFTREGQVLLEVDVAGELQGMVWIAFSFKDTGIGINQQSMEQIFEMFNQADNSNTRNYGGLGIGLTIVKRLCESMGGKIKVQSEMGHGSCFQVVLPFQVTQDDGVD